MSTPQATVNDGETAPTAADKRDLLKLAVQIDISARQQLSDALKSLRDRSLHLLEIITLAESIVFAVGFRDQRDMDPRVVLFLLVVLTSSLAVTCYLSRPAADWAIALDMSKLADGARKGAEFCTCVQEVLDASKTKDNGLEIKRRQNVFKRYLLALTASMIIAALIITGELLKR